MPFEEFLRLYPEECCTLLAAGAFYVLLFFIVFTVFAIVDGICRIFSLRRLSALCIGFHSGSIAGSCHCHGCPSRKICLYYTDNRRLTRWIRQLRAKKKEP